MRTLTAQQTAALSAPAGYASHVRVRVLRGGVWLNLSELGPPKLDFLLEAEVSESIESPVATATVRCAREVHGFSLAPLVMTSTFNLVGGFYAPLLAEGRTFVVEAAVSPLSMVPSEWMEVFRGRVDSVDVGGDGLSFEGRDLGGGLLQDTYIEAEREYGSDAGVAIEQVMAQLLSDNFLWPGYLRWLASTHFDDGSAGLPTPGHATGYWYLVGSFPNGTATTGTTEPAWPTGSGSSVADNHAVWYRQGPYLLSTPSAPGWMLGKFLQRGEPLMDALSALAQQLGWEVRWKWSNTAGAYGLTFWSPDRSATVPVRVFTEDEYQALSKVETSLADVRNAVEVVYSDPADLDVAGNPKRKTVQVSDSGSITAVGRRFMRMAEAATSNIDSSSEATTLANAALADLKDTPLGLEVEVDLHPELELGDLVGVEGNGYHFTGDQTGAVRALTLSGNASGATTKLTLLGKPSTSVRRWQAMEQRPTTAPASPFTGPSAPSGLNSATTAGGFKLSFSPPTTGAKAAAYELHVSASSGFTPSDSTRRVVGDLTEMVVTDLTPGTTYYAKVVGRDAKGNRGPASSEVTLTARYVEPRTLQPQVTYAALPLNSDFEAHNDGSQPPDGWEMGTGSWGTDAIIDTTKKASGNQAVRLEDTAVATSLRSAAFVCAQGDLVRCSAAIAVEGDLDLNHVALKVRWLDSSLEEISLTTAGTMASTGLSNFITTGYGNTMVAPVGTCYAQLVVEKSTSGAFKAWVDSCRVIVEPGLFVTTAGFEFENDFSDATPSGSAGYLLDSEGFVLFEGAVAVSPTPSSITTIALLPAGVRPLQDHVFPVVSDGGTFGSVKVQTNGQVRFISGVTTTRLWLDGIRYRSLLT